jgi:hypothetical protein
MPTAPSIPDTCPHERRPGLTVCLHCRHAAREAEAERRRRTMSRAGVVVGVVVIGITIAHAALRAREGTALAAALARVTASPSDAAPTLAVAAPGDGAAVAARTPAPAAPPAQESASASATAIDSAAAPSAPSAADSAGRNAAPAPARDSSGAMPAADSTVTAPTAPAAGVASTVAPPAPLVPQGRSELPEGMYVVRGGDTLTVHFDTEMGRTRRPEKFERIVRATLPEVYGPRAAAALAALRDGEIARSGDLLAELPARGVRIPSSDGWTIVLRPETRPGRDGPIVVRYVATVSR